jgi:NAD(P)-dependent dehydrogenase (short-subunit alcohol dehydrogenase family)
MSAAGRANIYDLSGRVVLVAGALGELGQAAARAFVEAGATVVAAARAAEPAWSALHATLGPRAERLTFVAADAQDEASVAHAVRGIVAQQGHLDVLANTIGGYDAGQPVTALTLETWQRMLDLNLRSAFLLAKHAGEAMRGQRWGRIMHTSSRAAFSGQKNAAAYAVAKRGVLTLIEAQAEELRHERVTVNAVVPSIIDTPTNRAAMPGADFTRWPRPEAIARVMLFLASDEAELISGAAIPVYGEA